MFKLYKDIIDKEKIRRAEFWQREDQIREWHWESRRERISGVDSPCLVLISSEMNRKRSLVLRWVPVVTCKGLK